MTKEEAINIYQGLINPRIKEAFEFFAPELAESDDERIRKEIIDYLGLVGKGDGDYAQPMIDRWIAYLEKQKEQNPAEWSNTDKIGWDEAFACVTRAEKAAKNEEELQNAVTAEKWLKEIKFKYYVHPVKQEWSEEDRHAIENCEYAIKETFKDEQNPHRIGTLAWLKSLHPSWKPSEEQEEPEYYQHFDPDC